MSLHKALKALWRVVPLLLVSDSTNLPMIWLVIRLTKTKLIQAWILGEVVYGGVGEWCFVFSIIEKRWMMRMHCWKSIVNVFCNYPFRALELYVKRRFRYHIRYTRPRLLAQRREHHQGRSTECAKVFSKLNYYLKHLGWPRRHWCSLWQSYP